MRVWLDDLRDPADYGFPDALWLKNSEEFKAFMNNRAKPYRRVENWHFDNDLGEKIEGYHCFMILEEKIIFGKMLIPDKVNVFVHTSNPSAASKFMGAAEGLKKYGVYIQRRHY